MAKQKPAIINTPLPSPDVVAAKLGISQKRVRELRKLIRLAPKPGWKDRRGRVN
jgi:hypothetical protein